MDDKRRILIVEDDQSIREVLYEILEIEGYAVSAASNGQEAIDYLQSTKDLPDLILLDLMMPIKDGFMFRQEQSQMPLIKDIPVVIMSADGNVSQKMTKLQVSSYLKKPIEIDDVLNLLKSTIDKRRAG